MKKLNKFTIIPGLVTGALIGLFLNGKIIDIPNGTHQGGIISAIGVGVILLTMFILTLIFRKIFKHYKMIN
jgi:butyrate kinase